MLPVSSEIPLATQAEGRKERNCFKMSDQTASFKVTLHRKGSNETEIRRFILPRSALSSYNILRDKLQVVFQSIKNRPFEVSWEDTDGDRVIISSDEELMIAMQEMVGDVHRLRIDTVDSEPVLNEDATDGPLHANVFCDSCSEGIKGFRYKCMECPDYDLCSQCESNHHHKEHFMIRIPKPIAWRPEFGHRLVHQMVKSARKHRSASHCGEGRGKGNAHHRRPCFSQDCGTDGQRYNFPQLFHQMLQNFWDPSILRPPQQEAAASTPSTSVEKKAGEQEDIPSTSAEKKAGEQDDGHVTYLKSIGETVAYLLDPLGIDVDIKVEPKENKDTKSKEKQEASNAEKVTKDDENPKINSANSTQAEPKADVSEGKEPKSAETSKGTDTLKVDADTDQWYLINADALVDSEEVVTGGNSSQGAESKPACLNAGNSPGKVNSGEKELKPVVGPQYPNLRDELRNQMHPNLPCPSPMYTLPHSVDSRGVPTASRGHGRNAITIIDPATNLPLPHHGIYNLPAPIPPPISHHGPIAGRNNPRHQPTHFFPTVTHPRPHIDQALTRMISMGFNNEGGWLASLLESVNGDVGAALDILTPVKK